VQVIQLETNAAGAPAPSLRVAVYDDSNQLIRTASGATDLELPLGQ
jgi:hypothetical protein